MIIITILVLVGLALSSVDSIEDAFSLRRPSVSMSRLFKSQSSLPGPNKTTMDNGESDSPAEESTVPPSMDPTVIPTLVPSESPSLAPSIGSVVLSVAPSIAVLSSSSENPTVAPTLTPTRVPTVDPTQSPTMAPSTMPSIEPSGQPTTAPSIVPTVEPSELPSLFPTTIEPTQVPSIAPSQAPTTIQPSVAPSTAPSTEVPSIEPSAAPTYSLQPTMSPSQVPSAEPTISFAPSEAPSLAPSCQPTLAPTESPTTISPSVAPSAQPSIAPSEAPSTEPSLQPTMEPTLSLSPSVEPTLSPSCVPTVQPSLLPTVEPSLKPSESPSVVPTVAPSELPSETPSAAPSVFPSEAPTCVPTVQPTSAMPTESPTVVPTVTPTVMPSSVPSIAPSMAPSAAPSTTAPSVMPTVDPTVAPTRPPSAAPSRAPSMAPSAPPSRNPSIQPSVRPSGAPSAAPSSSTPTMAPSLMPTEAPTLTPSAEPTEPPSAMPSQPSSEAPTLLPSEVPSTPPSEMPTVEPSLAPSAIPTVEPSASPTVLPSRIPSANPTVAPTFLPSHWPSSQPSSSPTSQPSRHPTRIPTGQPTRQPSRQPTGQPTNQPTRRPTGQPTGQPTNHPSRQPTRQPFAHPSALPTCQPSSSPTADPSSLPSAFPTSFIKTLFTFQATTSIQGSTNSVMDHAAIDAFTAAIAGTFAHVHAKDIFISAVTTTTSNGVIVTGVKRLRRAKDVQATYYNFKIEWQATVALEECGFNSFSEAYESFESRLSAATTDGSLVNHLRELDASTYTGVGLSNLAVNLVPTASPTSAPKKEAFETKYVIVTGVLGGFFLCMVPLVCYIMHRREAESELAEERQRDIEEANDRLRRRYPYVNPGRSGSSGLERELNLSKIYGEKGSSGEKYQLKRNHMRDTEMTGRPDNGGATGAAKTGKHVTINTVHTHIREIEPVSDLSESGEELNANYSSSDGEGELSRYSERSATPPIPANLMGQSELQYKVNHLIIVNKTMRNTLNLEMREFSSAISYFIKTNDELTMAQLSRLQDYTNKLEEENYKLGDRLEKLDQQQQQQNEGGEQYELSVEPSDPRSASPALTRVNLYNHHRRTPSPGAASLLIRKSSPIAFDQSISDDSVGGAGAGGPVAMTAAVPAPLRSQTQTAAQLSSIQQQHKSMQKGYSTGGSGLAAAVPAQYSRQGSALYNGVSSSSSSSPTVQQQQQRQAMYSNPLLSHTNSASIPIVVPEIPKIKTFTDVRAKYYADMVRRGATLGTAPTDANGQVVNQRRSLHHNVNYDARDPEEVVLAYNTQRNSAPTSPVVFAARQFQDVDRKLPTPPMNRGYSQAGSNSIGGSGGKRKLKQNLEEDAFLK